MGVTFNGVYCDEVITEYSEAIDFHDGPVARKGFICNWVDRITVAKGLLGFNTATTILGHITVNLPAQHPDIPFAYCNSVEIEPKGAPYQGTRASVWPKAIVWANYKCTPWSFSGIDDPGGQNQFPNPEGGYIYAEQQINSSAEYVGVPGIAGKFSGSGNLVPQDIGVRIGLLDLIVTFHRVPYLPAVQAYLLAGNKNSASFLGADVGHVIFNGYKTHQTRNTDGTITNDVTAEYQWRSIKWGYSFDAKAGIWDEVVSQVGATPFVPSADLNQTIPQGY